MKKYEMEEKTFWLTIDRNQSACLLFKTFGGFGLPSFLIEDQIKKNVSKRVLTRVHRCTAGVFKEFKSVPGKNVVELGNQIPGEEATTTKTEKQQTDSGV